MFELYPSSKPFIIEHKKVFSFTESLYISKALCNFIEERLTDKYKRIGLALENSSMFIFSSLSSWKLGATAILINPKSESQDIENLPRVDAFITSSKYKSRFSKLTPCIINIDNFVEQLKRTHANSSLDSVMNLSPKKEAIGVLTSGSEGSPKCVIHTFGSLQASASIVAKFINYSKRDKWIASLPFFHIGGFSIIFRCLFSRLPLVIPTSYSVASIAKAIRENKATLASFVPTQLSRLINRKEKFSHSINKFFIGGDSCNKALAQQALKLNYPITKVYGSSETGSMVTALKTEDVLTYPTSSGGSISPAIKIKCENDHISIKSPTLFKRYLDDQVETKKRKKRSWFFTNDFGKLLKDNAFLVITGRKGHLINTGGEKVQPTEVEQALLSIPFIKEAAVFGIPNREWGEMVCAAIVCKKTQIASIKTIKIHLKSKLANHKIPKKIYFLTSLPLNNTGKVNKKNLFNLFSNTTAKSFSTNI